MGSMSSIGSIEGDSPFDVKSKGSVQSQLDALDARVTALEKGEQGEDDSEPNAEDAITAQGVTGK